MPLWHIFSHPDTFTPTQRTAFAKDITNYYVDKGLPPFYVNVFFVDLNANQCFIGGLPRTNFVRISIEHIAIKYPSGDTDAEKSYRAGRMDLIDQVLKPHIVDRGDLDWEHHIQETPRDLWRVQGMVAPEPGSEGGAMWKAANAAVPYGPYSKK